MKLTSLILILILFSCSAQFVHAAPIFGTVKTNALVPTFNDVAVKANGSNVYVGYTDASFNLGIVSSANNGTTFSSPVLLCGGSCGVAPGSTADYKPQLAVSGQDLYVAWLDGDGNIAFASSTDKGVTFPGATGSGPNAGIERTTGGHQKSVPHIAVYGKNVYLEWIDNNGTVAFDASHNFGATWDHIKELSSNLGVVNHQIATAGSNVYVTWEDTVLDPSKDIKTVVISNNGTVVGASNNVSNTPGVASATPQIAAFKSSVYEVWHEAPTPSSADIFFATSANNATSFGGPINLSNSGGYAENPQIAANDSKVYVAWDDSITSTGTNEILFKASQDNGATFGSVINLSNNAGPSVFPEVALSGNNVYVVWDDNTINPAGSGNYADILFKASSDNGATFGGLKQLNTNAIAINQNTQQISASSKNISVMWSDQNNAVDYTSATYSPIEVQLDSSQYSLNATATITVTDPSANTNPTTQQAILIAVKSTTDNAGIPSLTLTETGVNTGIFSGSITYTSSGSTSGTILKANPSDVITATYRGQSSIASILPITIVFQFPSGYDRGDIAHITVTDPFDHAPAVVPQQITVHFTSNANPTGIDLQLTETGVNTNTFGSNAADSLIFMDTNNLFPSSGTVTINQTNTGANLDPNAIDTISESVSSTSDPVGITMNLNETGVNTGIFSGKLTLGSSSINHVAIKVAPGDILTIARGQAKENGLVTPNPNASVGAILVTADPLVDTVTASYHGVTKSVPVSRLFNPGGSGGGLVRPGLVLDVIASLSHGGSSYVPPSLTLNGLAATPGALPDNIRNEVLNHDPLKPMSPSNDNSFDFPFTLDGGGYVLAGLTNTITTQTEKIGTPSEIKLNIPSSTLTHVALYTNLRGNARDIDKSDTFVIYDKDKPLQIVDPHGYFANVKFDLFTTGIKNTIDYKITFAKPMEKSDIDLRVWDEKRASSDNKILDAWQVEPSSATAPSQTAPASASITTLPSTSTTPSIQNTPPVLATADLMPAIKDWGGYSSNPISDSDLLSKMGIQGKHIPSWVTKTTKWIVNGEISKQEFENMIKYLASTGTIK